MRASISEAHGSPGRAPTPAATHKAAQKYRERHPLPTQLDTPLMLLGIYEAPSVPGPEQSAGDLR